MSADTEHSNIAESAANAVDTAIAEHVAVETAAEAHEQAVEATALAEQATAVAESASSEAVATVAPAVEEVAATATAASERSVGVAQEQRSFEERVAEELASLRAHVEGHSHAPPAEPEPTAEVVEVAPDDNAGERQREAPHKREQPRGHRFGHH